MDTIIGRKSNTADLIKFNIQSLYTNEVFFNITSVVNEPWCDDVNTLPHMLQLSQFDDVEIVFLDNCDGVEVVIDNDQYQYQYLLFQFRHKKHSEIGNL